MSAKNKAKGFTLVELVVVVVIIGILAAVAAPRFLNKTDAAKAQVTLQKAAAMRSAIEILRADTGSYPTSDTALDTALEAYIRGGVPSVDYKTLSGGKVHVITGTDPTSIPTGVASGSVWIYNSTTGSIWVNDSDLFDGKYDG
jgi:general secretion pathway protein G